MRATTTITIALLLAGCSSVPVISSVPPGCVQTASIMVEQGPGRLVMTPECVDVTEGSAVTLSISPAPSGAVRTKSKRLGNSWLRRSNADGPVPSRIIVTPPPGSGGGGNGMRREYEFEIYVEGVGVLDPRLVVQ